LIAIFAIFKRGLTDNIFHAKVTNIKSLFKIADVVVLRNWKLKKYSSLSSERTYLGVLFSDHSVVEESILK